MGLAIVRFAGRIGALTEALRLFFEGIRDDDFIL